MNARTPEALVKGYYRSIDAGDYDALADGLAETFRQLRGDRTIEGRAAFVRFMSEERPNTDTTHEVDAILRAGDRVVAIGRLRRSDGTVSFGFVDVFSVEASRLAGLVTYSNERVERDVIR